MFGDKSGWENFIFILGGVVGEGLFWGQGQGQVYFRIWRQRDFYDKMKMQDVDQNGIRILKVVVKGIEMKDNGGIYQI